ncbi:prolipoprotein diacylglyceryl transferase [Methylovirgula sp. HY1]|uniref:prolipoprotein diacylglyceryl transferase n=1 Tax=Methylovirgula sp. HY1 TaxID=2822761 RepID=UPI001C5B4298|nr:prolipoprotein diacylglyceryl transferase [Methylovirgula sp. HY1]QXX75417.1 Prolipoprotein diacylglyceryl transferase [Methylovirgula sp. HY1]
MFLLIPYPVINPVLVHIGPFPIRWYALAYIAGLILGWAYVRHLVRKESLWRGLPRPSLAQIDDLLVYVAFGVILGGRAGYVLFYNLPLYLAHPLQIFELWEGGMSFHGGLAGAAVGIILFARRTKVPILSVMDIAAAAVPIGLCLGRIANFIKPELWGRPTDVPWAMIFPGSDGQPRHPSQLYEAALEGVVLFFIISLAIRLGALRRPGLTTGIFALGYGVARIISEFFRQPDPQLGYLWDGATMGQILSLPLIAAGLAFIVFALRRRAPKHESANHVS